MAYGDYTRWYEFYSVLPVEPGAQNNSIFVGSPGSPFEIDLSPFRAQGNGNGIRFRYDPVTDQIEVSLSLVLSTLRNGVWEGTPSWVDTYGHTVPAGSGDAIINSFLYHIWCNGAERSVPRGPHRNTLGRPYSNGTVQSNGDAYIRNYPNIDNVFRLEHTFVMPSGIGESGTQTFVFSLDVQNTLFGQTSIAMNQVSFTVAEVLGTYVPMALRRNGWRSLNAIPRGFIRRRQGNAWVDRSEESYETSNAPNSGHNRIRRGGTWLQLPPM